ncbi:hypothetical protein [Lampropedia aestuarii]|uniref:hypothetical protein n=1 Tax=Lampropedia aestuarii TaxID=2562762 RepID=UPI00246911B2|nr:hypothetical protein [Lampropedia aestuarii]MDH5858986.1 hypothetical protein [Lampropedia aestuarii]
MTDIVNVPAIPALPTPPSTNDPNNFSARADGFLGVLPEWSAGLSGVADSAKTNATVSCEYAEVALASANRADSKANEAAAFAELAKNAPTTFGTSGQTLVVQAGVVELAIETNRAFVSGQAVVIASIANPTSQRMYGIVSAYNASTGHLVVEVGAYTGVGSATAWTVVLGNAPAVAGLTIVNVSIDSHAASGYYHVISEEDVQLTMPAFPVFGDEIGFCNVSSGDVIVNWNGKTVKGTEPNPTEMRLPQYGKGVVKFNGSTWA